MTARNRVGAFFDLDGTVVAPPSLEWRFIAFLLARDKLPTSNITRWLLQLLQGMLFDLHGAVLENKQYLAGLRTALAADWESSLADRVPPLYAPALERVAWHRAQGHRVLLVSGTFDFLAQAIARKLPGPVDVCATQLEGRDGCWTGRLAGPHLDGAQKARAVRSLAARFGLSLWDSYAYGNSTSDLPMLDAVGHRFAVNAPARLSRIASNEGWPVCDWRKPAGTTSISDVQLAAGRVR